MRNIYILTLSIFLACVSVSKLYGQGPGGVTPSAWYRADAQNTVYSDAGITNATDNDNVQQWNEYLGAVHNLTQTTSGSRPVFSNATTLVNFNPTVTFNLDYLEYQPATGVDIIDRTQGTLYTAGYFNVVGPAGIMGFDATMDYPGLHTSNNGLNNLLFYTGGPGYQGVSSNSFTDNNYFISGANWTNGAGSTSAYASSIVSLNGVRSSYNTNELQNAVINNTSRDIRVGRDSNWGGMNGQVNEVIIFENALSMVEMDRVESYLAIKYGNTYAQGGSDYVNAAGATVWTADATYNQNIFGIARDDASELYQKQSKSTNQNQQLIIGAGNGLFNTNAANTNTLTNGQFLMVGDNGLEQNLKTPLVYTAGVNGETNFRFESVWKVQNINNVGQVTIAWPVGINNLYVVQSTDDTFASGNTFTPMITVVTINGVDYNTATVTLTDGQYITLAGYATAPGGVVGPDFWVKSDDAGAIATAWKDHSANADDIPAVGTWSLSPADRIHNFHPYTTGYTGSNYFYNDESALNPTNGLLSDVSHSIFSAVRPTTAGQGRIVGIDDTPGYASEPAFSIEGGQLRFYKFSGGANADQFTEEPFKVGAINVVSGIGNNPVAAGGTSTSAGGERVLGMNGVYKTYPNTDSGNRFHFNGQHLRIGDGAWSAPGPFPGDIMEVIWYKRPLTATEQSRVNSYLAMKNGASLAENYLASNSNVVWDISSNTGYNNHIFGLARDNVSGLHQKQATSTDVNQKLVIGNGSSFFDTNAANTNDLTDGQFLLVGDNGLAQSLTTPLAYTGGANGDTNFRFESIWKVQNTNGVGQVTVAWPVGVSNLYMVQSTDDTFATGDTFTPMTTVVAINGVDYNTATVTLADGEYFTFAGYQYAPGGVTSAAWYRADAVNTLFSDAGTTTVTDAASIQQWNEFNNKPFPLSQANATYRPEFSNATTLVNFNPTVNYDGTQKWLQYDPVDSDGYIIDRSQGALFSAGNTTNPAVFFGFGVSGAGNAVDDPGLYRFTADKFLFYPVIGEYDPVSTYTIDGPFIGGGTWENGAGVSGNNYVDITLDGYHETYDTSISNVNLANSRNTLMIGKADAGSQLTGQQNEMIVFDNRLTDEEVNRVESYLAIKYGQTLSAEQNRNYLSSTGTVVWDGIDASYYNNVFGIARDNISALHQKQSRSVNSNQKLIIGAGTSLFNTNAENTNNLTDGQFLIVGDNGLTQGLKVPLAYTSGTNGETNFRFESIWKVQNSGAVGAVTVAWPKGVNNLYLVQSPDAVFDATDDFEPMTGTLNINGVDYNTATVTLGDGEYFTFAGFAYAPGGVAGQGFWVRSDMAGDIATAWKDHSVNADDIAAVGTWVLSPADRAHNFHPYTTDYSTSKNFHNPNTQLNPGGGTNLTSYYIFSAVRPTAYTTGRITGIGTNGGAGYGSNPSIAMLLSGGSGYPNFYEYEATVTSRNFSEPFVLNTPNLFSAGAENGPLGGGNATYDGGRVRLGLNGRYQIYNAASTSNRFQFDGPNLRIGYSTYGTGAGVFSGDIMEVIWYDRHLEPFEEQKINSYLAVKNGTTLLTQNYLASNSLGYNNIVWDRTLNDGYNNNIFGIARDNISALHQKQSGSTNIGQKLVISTTGFADSNAANGMDLPNDLQYLLTGDNGLTQKLKVPLVYTGANGVVSHRFETIWKVQNTNGVGNITVAWPVEVENLYLVQSVDDSFDATDTFTAMDNTVTVNGTDYNTATVTLGDGEYFTFAGLLPDYCITGDCNPNTFLNTSDPNTIEYDNIVSTFHSTLMRDASTGALMVWGERMASNGTTNVLSPTEVNSTNYPGLTGDILKFAAGSNYTSGPQIAVLTTDGLFAWGTQGYLISSGLTSSSTFQPVSIGTYGVNGGTPKADGLPEGVAPENVKMLFGTYQTLALTTCSGEAWVLAQNANQYGDGAASSTANHQLWHRVHVDAVTTLDNVVAIRGNGYQTLMALTATGEVYTWGVNTILGDGSAMTSRPFATQMTLPAGVTPKMIGATGTTTSTYYVLGTTGNIYSLGTNTNRELGNFNTTSSNVWVQVQKSATAGDYLTDVVWISPQEHDRTYGSINVLTTDGRLWAWGNNNGQMLGGSGAAINPTEMPGSIPATDPYDSGKLNWTDKVIAVETGGHTSMIVKDNIQKYGYVGHRTNGSMGDGTSTSGTENQYNFSDTPEINLCGAPVEQGYCTQPGATGSPTEFTKTGISDREGAVGTWPGNVPNGFIAIQSADKGFVITRLTTAQINALDAVEGMLVYDTDEECVKLYNGTVWKCLERSCNE
ncbi:hypothetical protein NU10_13600 [Flavobacterium dauae]|uniref:hypothetical protein n=1 Tax=Flavobacterium dauae TaxID=1563479 RepID=UPI00101B380F|nr:hypothetical protein [Flavobacterium dauae]WLD23723.1 hypothetical protein NU10_13600 [Flavobacterium dauae]